jgi:autotransporter-associated beta strand protein
MLLALLTAERLACGHGFDISVNSYSNPTSLNVVSLAGYFDNFAVAPSPENVFTDEFSGTLTSGTMGNYYSTIEGFAATAGSVPPYTATFNIVSPLYFSDGLPNSHSPVVAQPASSGTFLNIYDLWAGNPYPVTNPHPGASAGNVVLTGTTSSAAGFGVSLYDPHELEHDLYLSSTSTQTYGEYGFAYTVTMHFPGTNTTLTTVPLVDIYAVSDPNLGDFPDNAGTAQQDAASVAIFQVATRAAAPSWATATSGSWTAVANWTMWSGNGAAGSPPTGAGVQVAIGAATSKSLTIDLDEPMTVGALIFGNSASNTAGYTIASGSAGTLTLNNLTAGAQIYVSGGSNAISANTVLGDNLWVTPGSGTALLISSNLSESSSGRSVTLSGPGTLVLSGSNSFTGGTFVEAGSLIVTTDNAIEDGTNVSVGSNLSAFGTVTPTHAERAASLPGTAPVPEPGTLGVLTAAGAILILRRFLTACSRAI